MRPPPIDWNLPPDQQAWSVFQAVQAQVYGRGDVRPVDARSEAIADAEVQRQMVAAFEGAAWAWRSAPRDKVQHASGAVGLLRLRWTGRACGELLQPGSSRLLIARYSQARPPGHEGVVIAGLALKLFRHAAPAVDLLMFPRIFRRIRPSDAWQHALSTSAISPFDPGSPDLTSGEASMVSRISALLVRTAATAGADTDRVQPHAMPLPLALRGDPPAGRLSVHHTTRAANLLARCGDDPFATPPAEREEPRHTLSYDGEPLVEKMQGKPWAHVHVDDEAEPRGVLHLETSLHLGPVGDRWLHFTHPRG